ncbi:hypothetical protein KDRO_A02000 [Kluyveromyces lactis]|nr:hypothetical protein KDRO_A02000 [Kluyveromyces lactis]
MMLAHRNCGSLRSSSGANGISSLFDSELRATELIISVPFKLTQSVCNFVRLRDQVLKERTSGFSERMEKIQFRKFPICARKIGGFLYCVSFTPIQLPKLFRDASLYSGNAVSRAMFYFPLFFFFLWSLCLTMPPSTVHHNLRCCTFYQSLY